VEESGFETLTNEEKKVYMLVSDLLSEADGEQNSGGRPLSHRFMAVKAGQLTGVNVWGSKILDYTFSNHSCLGIIESLCKYRR
jgi:hypothetical protein